MFLGVNPAVFSADVWTDVTVSLILSHVQGWNVNFGSRNGPSRVFRQEVRSGSSHMMAVVAVDASKDKMPWSPRGGFRSGHRALLDTGHGSEGADSDVFMEL